MKKAKTAKTCPDYKTGLRQAVDAVAERIGYGRALDVLLNEMAPTLHSLTRTPPGYGYVLPLQPAKRKSA